MDQPTTVRGHQPEITTALRSKFMMNGGANVIDTFRLEPSEVARRASTRCLTTLSPQLARTRTTASHSRRRLTEVAEVADEHLQPGFQLLLIVCRACLDEFRF